MKEQRNKEKFPIWLGVITALYLLLVIIGDPSPTTAIISFIAIVCGMKCREWAFKVKANPSIAYLVGLFFALLGLLVYYIYYNSKSQPKCNLCGERLSTKNDLKVHRKAVHKV